MRWVPIIAVVVVLVTVGQCGHSIRVDIQSQDRLRCTGHQLAWSIDDDSGIHLQGEGISSLSWQSWDETGKCGVYLLGNFSVCARQRIDTSRLFPMNESQNLNESLNLTDEYDVPWLEEEV